MFHICNTLFDQCLLAFEPISTTDVKHLMLNEMSNTLYTKFGFRRKTSFYRIMSEYEIRKREPSIGDTTDYIGIIGLLGVLYLVLK